MEDGLQRGLCDFYCIWDLYQQYLASEQLMLNRRTQLLVSYESANRNWDKAKAYKKDEVGCTSFICLSIWLPLWRWPLLRVGWPIHDVIFLAKHLVENGRVHGRWICIQLCLA